MGIPREISFACLRLIGLFFRVTGLPAWLEAKPAPGVTEIPSAFSIMFGCKAADKVLNATVGEVKAECYNGDYIPPSAFPVEEACVDPEPCDLSLISSMVPPVPNFITTTANLSTTINHDEKVDYACPDGKFLSDDLDVNSDGLFNLACYNGELEKEAAWPKEADVSDRINPLANFNFWFFSVQGQMHQYFCAGGGWL